MCMMEQSLFGRVGGRTEVGLEMRGLTMRTAADTVAATVVIREDGGRAVSRWVWRCRWESATIVKTGGKCVLRAGTLARAFGHLGLDELDLELMVSGCAMVEIGEAVGKAPYLQRLRLAVRPGESAAAACAGAGCAVCDECVRRAGETALHGGAPRDQFALGVAAVALGCARLKELALELPEESRLPWGRVWGQTVQMCVLLSRLARFADFTRRG